MSWGTTKWEPWDLACSSPIAQVPARVHSYVCTHVRVCIHVYPCVCIHYTPTWTLRKLKFCQKLKFKSLSVLQTNRNSDFPPPPWFYPTNGWYLFWYLRSRLSCFATALLWLTSSRAWDGGWLSTGCGCLGTDAWCDPARLVLRPGKSTPMGTGSAVPLPCCCCLTDDMAFARGKGENSS